ncbi:conserved hypothetical protein [Culex quinquefasciatus]|uniref:Uncharacterized protein n=1 Tax=Culex quinquefasciatus TaxID=7176 RepID=B0WUK2_CULQU|nr:conserved hypothetical protein [Culex quinquefasciatus]|eukprot:XP_001858886.1 conserved hypothetical protein [Culex quinquefasciatus]
MFSHFGTSEMYLLQVPPTYDEFVLYQSTIVIQAQNSSTSPTSSSSRTSCSVMQQPINHNRWRAVLLSIFLNLHVCSHLSHSLKRLVIVLRPPQMCVCALHSLPILAIVYSETQSVSSENRTTNRVDMELCERVPPQVWQRRGFLARAAAAGNRPDIVRSVGKGAKRAAWRWAKDRASVAARWTWLLAQISDLEYRIRQHNELHNKIKVNKGAVTLEDVPVQSVNGYRGTLPGNSKPLDDGYDAAAGSATPNGAYDQTGGSCRTRPFHRNGFRKRKLLQTANLHTISKKAARPSTVKCGCAWPLHPCALCTGRQDPTAPRDLPDTMPASDRVALLDPCFHPVLSFPEDVSHSVHFEAIMRIPDWQNKMIRCSAKALSKSLSNRTSRGGVGDGGGGDGSSPPAQFFSSGDEGGGGHKKYGPDGKRKYNKHNKLHGSQELANHKLKKSKSRRNLLLASNSNSSSTGHRNLPAIPPVGSAPVRPPAASRHPRRHSTTELEQQYEQSLSSSSRERVAVSLNQSLNKKERRRTVSTKMVVKDEFRRSSTPDIKEIIPPYESLQFPLADDLYEEMVRTMPSDHLQLVEDAIVKLTRPNRPNNNLLLANRTGTGLNLAPSSSGLLTNPLSSNLSTTSTTLSATEATDLDEPLDENEEELARATQLERKRVMERLLQNSDENNRLFVVGGGAGGVRVVLDDDDPMDDEETDTGESLFVEEDDPNDPEWYDRPGRGRTCNLLRRNLLGEIAQQHKARVKCANCGGIHTMNFRGCAARKKYQGGAGQEEASACIPPLAKRFHQPRVE